MNTISFIGRLTADPSISTMKDKTKIAQFVVAVQKTKDSADFFRCVAWNKDADIVEKYCSKGIKVGCTGSLHTRTYENKKGEKQSTWEIILNKIDLLSFKDEKKEEEKDDESIDLPFEPC